MIKIKTSEVDNGGSSAQILTWEDSSTWPMFCIAARPDWVEWGFAPTSDTTSGAVFGRKKKCFFHGLINLCNYTPHRPMFSSGGLYLVGSMTPASCDPIPSYTPSVQLEGSRVRSAASSPLKDSPFHLLLCCYPFFPLWLWSAVLAGAVLICVVHC